ncbi:MAG: hypothetical protein HC894_30835 [Microcoleus sp. SM1_3_4]|nr:hypothetical protein [Microcoleus sp. SM1_3_4]
MLQLIQEAGESSQQPVKMPSPPSGGMPVPPPPNLHPKLELPANLIKLYQIPQIAASRIIHAPATASVRYLAQLMFKYNVSYVLITETAEQKFHWQRQFQIYRSQFPQTDRHGYFPRYRAVASPRN